MSPAGAPVGDTLGMSVPAPRWILHIDMDAFFASVEQRDDPSLRGKPVLVAFDRPRSVVTAASYEARPFGCRSAQPIAMAKRLCPHAILVPPRIEHYAAVSERMFTMLADLSPLVEPLSIDEAFVDLTGTERLLGAPWDVAEALRARVKRELGLTASCGLAPNKFLAKLGSDMKKPDGLTVLRPGEVERLLEPLPVGRIWGVGPKAEERLALRGIRTIGDLLKVGPERLAREWGDAARHWCELARGIDDREVTPDTEAKSIGQERTFETNLEDPDEVRAVMLAETEDVARRLRRSGLAAREVHVKLRYGDFETITRQATLETATDVTGELFRAARALFDTWAAASYRPVRLAGVSVSRFSRDGHQASLFEAKEHERGRRLDAAMDALRDRFGDASLRRAGGRVEEGLAPSDKPPPRRKGT